MPDVPSLADVRVERVQDQLVLRWRWDGLARDVAAPRVRVTSGPAPDSMNENVADVEDATELVVPDQGARRYFRVTTEAGDGLVVAERLVPLAGTLNFRDLGGYPATDGRRVRWGLLYRSDALAATTEADRDYLVALGVRSVHDFRYGAEREQAPNLLPETFSTHWWAIGGEVVQRPDVIELMRTRGPEMFGVDAMVAMYENMLVDHARSFGSLFTHLAGPDALPAIFHCTAGKDRTGIAAALLLLVLGVPDPVVLDDYELSTEFRLGRRLHELGPRLLEAGVDIDAVRPYLSAPREVLERSLVWLREQHGPVSDYLTGPAGVAPEAIERLRDALLE